MGADKRRYRSVDELTEQVIGAAYAVSNVLGTGFLEKVYDNALAHELRKLKLSIVQQAPIEAIYDGVVVGQYYADILVEDTVVIELKYANPLNDSHVAQCLNYLRATDKTIALLLNFATSRVQVKRVVLNHK